MATDRITIKHLKALCDRLNKVTGSPLDYSHRDENDQFVAHVGHFHISQAYRGYCLHRLSNTSGGVSTPLSGGHGPARPLYDQMRALLTGYEMAKGV